MIGGGPDMGVERALKFGIALPDLIGALINRTFAAGQPILIRPAWSSHAAGIGGRLKLGAIGRSELMHVPIGE